MFVEPVIVLANDLSQSGDAFVDCYPRNAKRIPATSFFGPIVQSGERCPCKAEVGSSNLPRSTTLHRVSVTRRMSLR